MIESRILREPKRGAPRVIAVFSWRHDAHLVPGLIANVSPFVHGWVGWDDTAGGTGEPARRAALLERARAMGADWILAADPDERFEDRLALRLPQMLARGQSNLWTFTVREMFSPNAYRDDGLWGRKEKVALFPAAAGPASGLALHGPWVADPESFATRAARVNLYHLRMAAAARRTLRREHYARIDPDRIYQRVGYDYLDDMRGAVLEPVPEGRQFTPPFVEDGGLWAEAPTDARPPRSDALEHRLCFVAEAAAARGHAAASHVLTDLCKASPQDRDLQKCAAAMSRVAGRTDDAAEADFVLPAADWRRWAGAAATLREGAAVTRSDLAVVVIGMGAPPELAQAVASLRQQDTAAEIVVVNSGGGAPEQVLAEHLEHVRLISVAPRLYAGAARNIGIDASRARWVAFLASDCTALPGWVAGRLARHRTGALSVSTPVVSARPGRLASRAFNHLRYWSRSPRTHPAEVAHYGRSYDRQLFIDAGYFPTGLRVAEDTAFNHLADRIAAPVWAPEVLTTHRDPAGLWSLLRDSFARGRRRAAQHPLAQKTGRTHLLRRVRDEIRMWRLAGREAAEADRTLTPAQLAAQWLAASADGLGLYLELRRLGRADRALARAIEGGPDAVRAAALAWRLDDQDWRKAYRIGLQRSETGDGTAADWFREALALAPGEEAILQALARLALAPGGDLAKGLAEAEAAARAAPLSSGAWQVAADLALAAGAPATALAHARRALFAALEDPLVHSWMAGVHRAAGDPVGALFRESSAARLAAAAAARAAATAGTPDLYQTPQQ